MRAYCVLVIATVVAVSYAVPMARVRRRRQLGTADASPFFKSFRDGFAFNPNSGNQNPLLAAAGPGLNQLSGLTNSFVSQLGPAQREQAGVQAQPDLSALAAARAQQQAVDLQGLTSGQFTGLAPIPVPGFPGPQDIPRIPGVNTIPGLDSWNYLIGTLIPQTIPATNQLLGGSIGRLLPQETTQNIAKEMYDAVKPKSADVDVQRMMGRWFTVINSPHSIREACTVSHFGALTNNTYSATFTVLKFYREGNSMGPPRFALGYGFKTGSDGQFTVHSSNSPDSEPFWVVKTGPLNEFNQYDYAIISNWVKYPTFVLARDPERFQRYYMREVLEYLKENEYINTITRALNMISPVDYSQCQYTPTFSAVG